MKTTYTEPNRMFYGNWFIWVGTRNGERKNTVVSWHSEGGHRSNEVSLVVTTSETNRINYLYFCWAIGQHRRRIVASSVLSHVLVVASCASLLFHPDLVCLQAWNASKLNKLLTQRHAFCRVVYWFPCVHGYIIRKYIKNEFQKLENSDK
jgi:hypothetical protein